MRRTRLTTGLQADDIKRAVTMPDLLERLGMDPPRQGFILCPFHQDSDASLKVYQGDRGWHCFGCGQGGSVIDFVMQYLGLSFSDAVQELGRMYGLVGGSRTETLIRRTQSDIRRARAERDQAEYDYWADRVTNYRKIMNQKHNDWTPELEDACQNIAYAEYRMEEAYDKLRH